MYIKDLQQCLNKGMISQKEYDEIFKKMSISPDGNQLIGGIPKTKGVIKYYLEGDMSDNSLLEFLTTRITVPYGAEDIDPLFRTYGVMVCGICDYWSWFTKDNITPHAISCGHKPIEYASDKELWKMIAICSRYYEVFYEREYDRIKEKQMDDNFYNFNKLVDLYIEDTICDGELFCGHRREECENYKTEECRKCLVKYLNETENNKV